MSANHDPTHDSVDPMRATQHDLAFDEFRVQLNEAKEHIAALELTVYRQQQQMSLFQQQLRKMYAQLQGQGGNEGAEAGGDPRDEIPPHY